MTLTKSEYVQKLLDQVSGLNMPNGNPRLKAVVRDLCEGIMSLIEKHDLTEEEFWQTIAFLQNAAPEFGLIIPGLGIEHFIDVRLDAMEEDVGVKGGTPRTIEGPLYVENSPISEGSAQLTKSDDGAELLSVSGVVKNLNKEPIPGALVHVWHANSKGNYSHFDPSQPAFNNRGRIRTGADGRYAFNSTMPLGYSVPPGGMTEQLLHSIGRHGSRPAHIHFFVEAPGYRALTTQLNIADDPLLHDDFAFATRDGLVPEIHREEKGAYIKFDFVLVPARNDKETNLSRRPRVISPNT